MNTKTILALGILAFTTFKLVGSEASRAKYETAPFTSVEKDDVFEIRDYPEITVVSTTGKGSDADGAFMRLFRYIGGGNEGGTKIEMTTPVFMDHGEKETAMSFVVPKSVVASGAPAPTAPQVSLAKRAGGRFAVMRFTGLRSTKNEEAALTKLRDWM